MVARKNLAVNLVANPYPAPKVIVSDQTVCEVCDGRVIKTKDWNAHKGSKKHRLNEDALRVKENTNMREKTEESIVADAAGGWGAPAFGTDSVNRASTGNFNGTCYACGKEGHSKRDCELASGNRGCFNCGEQGHTRANCTNQRQGGGGGGGGGPCYTCGETGHRKADCPQGAGGSRGGGGGGNCHNCGNPGHRKAECTEPRAMICRNCDEKGHMSRDCPKPKDWSKHKCNNCGNFGHGVKRCTEPPKENGYSSGGGGGGWETTASTVPAGDWNDGNDGNDAQAQGSWNDNGEEAQGGWNDNEDGGIPQEAAAECNW